MVQTEFSFSHSWSEHHWYFKPHSQGSCSATCSGMVWERMEQAVYYILPIWSSCFWVNFENSIVFYSISWQNSLVRLWHKYRWNTQWKNAMNFLLPVAGMYLLCLHSPSGNNFGSCICLSNTFYLCGKSLTELSQQLMS